MSRRSCLPPSSCEHAGWATSDTPAVGIRSVIPTRWVEAVELVASGKVRIDVSETLPLVEAARAHESLEAGNTVGKLVLVV